MERSRAHEIIDGLREYLGEHFRGVEFREREEAITRNVLLIGDGGAYRLAITETFLDGDEETTGQLRKVRQWDLAGLLRDSAGRVVTLTTDGPTIEA